MNQTILVTGGTGLAGSNIAVLLREKGYRVRALVRRTDGTESLVEKGIEVMTGDITDPASLDRAMASASGVIHAAAALGGTWSSFGPDDFWAVNHQGTLNVLDAAKKAGVEKTVVIDTHSILDPFFTHTERSPVILIEEVNSHYVRSKRAAYYGGLYRAATGQNICFVTPGAIYGPGILVERSLDPTSFTSVLLRGIKGEIDTFLTYPMFWTFVQDLAQICVRALEKGEIGRRYLAMGGDADVSSLAAFCNQGAELAGSTHRVREIDPNDPNAPNIGTMRQFALRKYARPYVDCTATTESLGWAPTPRAEAITRTINWARSVGKLAGPDTVAA